MSEWCFVVLKDADPKKTKTKYLQPHNELNSSPRKNAPLSFLGGGEWAFSGLKNDTDR